MRGDISDVKSTMNVWFEISLDKQTEHEFYTKFLISQMT